MTTFDHEHIRELLVPYALGVLSDDEARTVRRALESSSELRAELSEIEGTGAALVAGSVQKEAAPVFIKARVLDSIGAADRSSIATLDRADRDRRRWSVLVPSILAAGLAGTCAVLALVTVSLDQDLDDARRDLQAGAQRQSNVPADMALHTVATSGPMKNATGRLIQISRDRYVLLLEDVPDPGAGNSWQVWTASSRGVVKNIGQWVDGASSQAILVSDADIREVMVSHEKTERPLTVPSSAAIADVKL